MDRNGDGPVAVPRDVVKRRSAFHKQLTMRDSVVATGYSDLQFRTLTIALDHEGGLPDHVVHTAKRVGYVTERVTDSVYKLHAAIPNVQGWDDAGAEDVDTVWIASRSGGGGDKVYHTSPKCRHVQDARNARPVAESSRALDDRRECQEPECGGGNPGNRGGSGDGHIHSLRAAAAGDDGE